MTGSIRCSDVTSSRDFEPSQGVRNDVRLHLSGHLLEDTRVPEEK